MISSIITLIIPFQGSQREGDEARPADQEDDK